MSTHANSTAPAHADLPDITVITPVFDESKKHILFFTASRGHHADVGGILPGSMPPTSKTIFDEGAQVTTFKIVRAGKYDRDGLIERLVTEPAKYPGSTGSRCFRDVESDLQAQIAANNRGAQLLHARTSTRSSASRSPASRSHLADARTRSTLAVIAEYGIKTVQAYMFHIRNNAEDAVRNLLRGVAAKMGTRLHAIDYMDDGTPIELTITIDPEAGSAVFDFEGTGPQSYSSLNAPVSVCSSAVSASPRPLMPFLARASRSLTLALLLLRAVYCLRVLVDEEIPLNAGCLAPIELRIPEGSIINPDETCAVVGGNVMTSQRVTDVVLRCFECVPLSLSHLALEPPPLFLS